MGSRLLIACLLFVLFPARDSSAQIKYNLPQIANGSFSSVSFRTTFILTNNTDTATIVGLNLTDDNGNPLIVALGTFGSGSQFSIPLDSGSTRFLQTDGLGNGVVGAAVATASVSIGVSAIFTVYDTFGNYMTEAGVGPSDLLASFVLPVDVGGQYNTGIALFNAGSMNAALTAILVGADGNEVSRTTLNLNSGAHRAVFIAGQNQLFPALTSFRGTLVVQSPVPISALVLRQYQSPALLSYTSLPVVSRSSSKVTLNLAHVANGSYGTISFKTSLLIFNTSSSPAAVTVTFTQDNGSPLVVTIPGSGPGTGTNSSFSFTLAAGASIFLQTDGLGTGIAGAAGIVSNVPVGASAIFTVLDSQGRFQTEAGVGDSPASKTLTLPVDVHGSFDTGIAFYNPGSSTVTLSFKLLDTNGVVLNTGSQPLVSKGHLATFVDNLFPGTGNFDGSLAVSTDGVVAATSLRQYASGVTYTTLPTTSGVSAGKAFITLTLPKTLTGITARSSDPEVVLSQSLTQGYGLAGTVVGPGQGIQVSAKDGAGNVFSASVDPLTGKYLLVVPAGSYTLTAYYHPSIPTYASAIAMTYADPVPVQVPVNTSRDIALPSVALYSVSGLISGLSGLPAGTNSAIILTSSDNSIQGAFVPDVNGLYQGALPAGNYFASIKREPVQYGPLQTGSLQLYSIGAMTVAGGAASVDFSIPATATQSGTVGGGTSLLIPAGSRVTVADAAAPTMSQVNCLTPPAAGYATTDLAGGYQTVLSQGRSYLTSVTIKPQGTSLYGELTYPAGAPAMPVTGNTVLDLTFPKLPGFATIYGTVTDGTGSAMPNVVVTASTQSVDGATVGFKISTKTDAGGAYSLLVLSGTNYQVAFTPPAPLP